MSSTELSADRRRADTHVTRLMGALFAIGAVGFVVGPLDAYANRVGAHADALTFFVASVLFTGGGLTQSWLAYPERRADRAGRLAWRGAWIQSVGTVLFNFMTFEAISHAASNGRYTALVWSPNALGSVCFLLSGVLLYSSAPRVGWRLAHRAAGWWEPGVNLLGCVLFGVSAIAGFATRSGQLLDLTAANWTTSLGAACFLAVGLAALIAGMTFKVPRLSRLVAFERALEREVAGVGRELEMDALRAGDVAERTIEVAERTLTSQAVELEREGEQEVVHVERVLERDFLIKRDGE